MNTKLEPGDLAALRRLVEALVMLAPSGVPTEHKIWVDPACLPLPHGILDRLAPTAKLCGATTEAVTCEILIRRLNEARAEVARLKDWKESAIAVDPPRQEIGKALGVAVGDSIHDKILPGIERLTARVAELESAGDKLFVFAAVFAAGEAHAAGREFMIPQHADTLLQWERLHLGGRRPLAETGLLEPTAHTAPGGKERGE